MTTNSPSSLRGGDETAVSGAGHLPAAGPSDLTDVGAPSDATVIRSTPIATAPATEPGAASAPDTNFGRYELMGEIARGGMGVVYRARQHGLERLVALKMILGTGTDTEAAERFLQEARAAAALDHPNVVPIYDIGEANGRPYFTMALVEGPNLRGYVETCGMVPIADVVGLFSQVVEGVAHAHKHGIIHRDLKPANVLMDRDGRPRVTDFGLAKRCAVDSHLTATGQVVGTPSYMAPEQARDSKDVGPAADVYSLGAILYFLLTGRPPFHGESFTDLLLKVVSEMPVPPREIRADVPADLEALCLRCLEKRPTDRFSDAQGLAAALVPFVNEYHVSSGGRTSPLVRIGAPRPSVDKVPDLSAAIASRPASPEPSLSVMALAEKAPRNRRPVVIGLAALSLGLIGLLFYLATRDEKRPSAVEPEAQGTASLPLLPPDPTAPVPPGPVPVIAPPLPTPAAANADPFAWPAPTRRDFGLKLEIRAKAAREDADGKILLHAGTLIELHITADKDCNVSIWVLDSAGGEARFFPNKYEQDDRLVAGRTRVFPGKDGGAYEATPTVGSADRLRVIATTGERIVFPEGVLQGQFSTYTAPADRERLAAVISGPRGILLKKSDASGAPAAVAEVERLFFVEK
jgi:serine/threonine protein kinase